MKDENPLKSIAFAYLIIFLLAPILLLPIFTSVGIVACIWSGHVVDSVLGDPPDRSHPAFWFWFALLFVGEVIAAVFAYSLIALPLIIRSSRTATATAPSKAISNLLGRINRFLAQKIHDLAVCYQKLMTEFLERNKR